MNITTNKKLSLELGGKAAHIVFADAAGREFSMAKNDIAERIPSKVTLMPDNFRNSLSQKEFNGLLNYLLNHK